MKKVFLLSVVSALVTISGAAVSVSAADTSAITAKASDCALDGVTLKDTDAESPILYDADHDCILGIGEFSTATYTVPEGTDGSYDIYLEVSKAASAFVAGSTPITVSANGEAITVPSLSIEPCSMEQMGLADGAASYMDDMGLFLIQSDVTLKAGDTITIGGVAGCEYFYDGGYMSSMPALGDMQFYAHGTSVEAGYAENPQTSPADNTADDSDPLSGLEIAWLGSSVTYGQGAGGYSMADAIEENHPGTACYKYAISGTTLADCKTDASLPTDGDGSHGSYVQRLNQLNPAQNYDLFIVQLSTNDATAGIEMGEITDSDAMEEFDTSTVLGSMEYIIAYVKETWGCPVMFYTGTKYDSEQYEKMVASLYELQEKWEIGVIDLWNNEEMNQVSEEDYAVYMKDSIHPFKEGYTDWWTPVFEQEISEYIG